MNIGMNYEYHFTKNKTLSLHLSLKEEQSGVGCLAVVVSVRQ